MGVLIQAHRGESSNLPENTLAAFRQAVTSGFHAIELDVRATHDGVVVVMHDAGIDRTTDGNGRVADFDFAELRHYHTGDGPIPTLDEVLQHCADFEGLWNIEIKHRKATPGAIAALRKHGVLQRSQISSMDPAALAKARKLAPELTLGMIVLGPPDEADVAEAEATGCTWMNLDHDFFTPIAGFKIAVWTVNDPECAQELIAAGVDSIITDSRELLVNPGALLHW